ncbi:hypothetical protein WJX74_010716 [Apatococcus lobatus]|uniref:Complex III subunit 9 n=2 Tax=Apatococcus TaxID=904362 RepID=A0AAW1SV55_9CHLO
MAAAQLMDLGYRVFMRRNSVYVAFIIGGALAGEKIVNSSFNTAWESNNQGKLFKDIAAKKAAESGGDDGGEDDGGDDDE